jgi:hypothetical protein
MNSRRLAGFATDRLRRSRNIQASSKTQQEQCWRLSTTFPCIGLHSAELRSRPNINWSRWRVSRDAPRLSCDVSRRKKTVCAKTLAKTRRIECTELRIWFWSGGATTSPLPGSPLYFTGRSGEAPLSFTKNTRNLAGWESLAFFETTWTSSGDS